MLKFSLLRPAGLRSILRDSSSGAQQAAAVHDAARKAFRSPPPIPLAEKNVYTVDARHSRRIAAATAHGAEQETR